MERKRWKVSYGVGDNGGSENDVVDEDGEGVFRSIYGDEIAEQLVKDHNAVIELELALEGIFQAWNHAPPLELIAKLSAAVDTARVTLANIKGQP